LLSACALHARQASAPTPFLPVRALWTLALNNAITAPPVYDAGSGFFSIEAGRLVAYDLATGSQSWIASAAPRSQPAAGDGLIFVADAESVTALRESDGDVAWTVPFTERVTAPLVWDNGWLIATNSSGTTVAFRARDGKEIWRRDIGSPVSTAPALAADRVYVAPDDGRIVALQVTTGETVWEHRLGGAGTCVLALDDTIFVGSRDNFLYAIDARQGDILWRWRTGDDVLGPFALDQKRLYFVSLDNVLRGMDRRTGAQLWKRALPMRPTTGPILGGTALLIAGLESSLRAFDVKDGKPGNDIRADNVLVAPPAIVHVPSLAGPLLIYVTTDVANTATVTAAVHSLDPPVAGPMAPLPNAVKP
jgi:outer membrane protein assembly factor BamB